MTSRFTLPTMLHFRDRGARTYDHVAEFVTNDMEHACQAYDKARVRNAQLIELGAQVLDSIDWEYLALRPRDK